MAPRPVSTSIWLHAVSYFIGFAQVSFTKGLPDSATKLVVWLFVLIVIYAYLRGIYSGRNWVRWLSVVLTACGTVVIPWHLPGISNFSGKAVYLTQCALLIAAAILLFVPASRAWYRPNKSVQADAPARTV